MLRCGAGRRATRRLGATCVAVCVAAGLGGPARAMAQSDRPEGERSARRAAELDRLARSRTVRGALRRAWLLGRITRVEHDAWRQVYRDARRAARRLPGVRGQQLGAVVAALEGMAARRKLSPDRLDAAFATLRRNLDHWRHRGAPPPGWRFTTRDGVVIQYYPGRGLQLQPLASWGRVNGLAKRCGRARERVRRADGPMEEQRAAKEIVHARGGLRDERLARHGCRVRTLRRTVDALLDLAARRGDFLAWEYLFPFGGGAPPWISGMAQGTAVQALARAARALDEPRYRRAARLALGAFEAAPPTGVAVRSGRRARHYLMYSFDPGLRILNGHLQAVTALRDMTVLSGSRRARRLYLRGDRAARAALERFDTGAWSLYAAGGDEATADYHRLQRRFLANLCRRTDRGAYCAARRRFRRYEGEPPRIAISGPRRPRARRPTRIAVHLSKVSDVSVRVTDRRGTSLRRVMRLPRGHHTIGWTPSRRGRHRLRIEARGPTGPKAVEVSQVRVIEARR